MTGTSMTVDLAHVERVATALYLAERWLGRRALEDADQRMLVARIAVAGRYELPRGCDVSPLLVGGVVVGEYAPVDGTTVLTFSDLFLSSLAKCERSAAPATPSPASQEALS